MLVTFAALVLAADPVPAQCDAAQSQPEMNACAGRDLALADAAMNREWKRLLPLMKERDKDLDRRFDKRPGYVDALLAGQRAWLKYRDAYCQSYAYFARGGSMGPMQLYG